MLSPRKDDQEKMINQRLNIIDFNISIGISTLYFSHYKAKEEIQSSLSKDPFCKIFLENN